VYERLCTSGCVTEPRQRVSDSFFDRALRGKKAAKAWTDLPGARDLLAQREWVRSPPLSPSEGVPAQEFFARTFGRKESRAARSRPGPHAGAGRAQFECDRAPKPLRFARANGGLSRPAPLNRARL
jgi:hypothetical protein